MAFPTIDLKKDYVERAIFDYIRFNSDQKAIEDFINITLKSVTDGESGADWIGMTPITETGANNTVQSVIEALITRLKATTDSASGADLIGATAISGLSGSTVQALLESIKLAIDTHETANPMDHPAGSATDTILGNRTVNDAISSAMSDTGTLTEILSWIAKAIKTYFGTAGWKTAPTRTVEAINTDLVRHQTSADHDGRYYTKTQHQTSGQSQVHWDNIINKPAMADDSWKAPVATSADLPPTGNADGDLRIVLDEDAVYTWDAGAGAWKIIGASGNGISDHGTLQGLSDDDHLQYLRADGTRALTGNQDFGSNQALNLAVHNSDTAPTSPVIGQLWYDTINNQLKVYKGEVSGWCDVSGQGAVIRDLEIVTGAGQTVFDLSSIGQYEVGTNVLTVYKKNANGRYEVLDEDDYTETSSTTVTIPSAVEGDIYYFKWFENSPEVINQAVQRDGTLQKNLNADLLDSQHGAYYLDYNNFTNIPSSFNPSTHKSTHASGGADALTPSDIGAVDKTGDSMSGMLTVPNIKAQITLSSSALPTEWPVGFVVGVVYNNGYPTNYGTIFSYRGTSENSVVQILQSWPGSDGGESYAWVRASRDNGSQFGTWRKLWAENNDGAGSGLDADSVDGVHITGSGTAGLRKITISTSDPSGGADGDVWFKYTP